MRIRIILILIAVACAACGSGGSDARETNVVASFYPLAFAAEQVGGPSVRVRNLTPPGVEPHDLEATPADVQELHDADLVLFVGGRFQPQLEDAAGGGEHVVYMLDTPGLDRLKNGDVHVWLDPLRYAVIVKQIGAALGRENQAGRLADRLRALDRDYQEGLADCGTRAIVTTHEAFGYLADRYGLEQVAISGASPEGEPTPKDFERAVDAVRDTGATTVFLEPLVSARVAQAIAREAGVNTAVLNPIEGLTGSEQDRGADYFSLMRANLATLRTALACR